MTNLICVSYSGLGTYKDCPSRFNRRYVIQEDGGPPPTRATAPQMFRGTDIHDSIENFLLGTGELHDEVPDHYLGFIQQLKDLGAIPEMKWGFDRSWGKQEFDDTDACMIRGMFDCVLPPIEDTVTIYEWKTGKIYDDHVEQRALYGLAGLLLYPEVEKCRVITTYLDQSSLKETTYMRSMLNTYKWMWEKRINEVQPPQPYPMVPSFKCRGCPYSKNNGGTCPN